MELNFSQMNSDKCLYRRITGNTKIFILIYVDDLLLVSNDEKDLNTVKSNICVKFKMKDLSEIKFFLGIKIERNHLKRTMTLSQEHYIDNLLKKFRMENCKTSNTPMEHNLKLSNTIGEELTSKPYKTLIGCLMYLMLCMRRDLSYSISYFSRFQICATDEHWEYLKRVLKYLQKTKTLKLTFDSTLDAGVLEGYVDADWANDTTDRKSTTGFIFKLFGGTVSWVSRKQNCVCLSSTEAEYIALSDCLCECLWLQKLLEDLDIKNFKPTVIYEDNQSCIHLASNEKRNSRLKHIDVKYNFVKDIVSKKLIVLQYKRSNEQLADIMTKRLNRVQFENLRLGLFN